MSKQQNIESSRAFFDNYNAGNLQAIDALHAPGYTTAYTPGFPGPLSEEQNRMMLEGMRAAFPDISFEITLEVADEEHVVTHWLMTGTHTGPLYAASSAVIQPTGKRIQLPGVTTMQIQDGKHKQAWVFYDQASMMAQLGLMPSP